MRNSQGMEFKIKVFPSSGKNLVKKQEDGTFKVYLTKPPLKGKANQQLIKIFAEYIGVKEYQVEIIKGERGRNKIVRVCN